MKNFTCIKIIVFILLVFIESVNAQIVIGKPNLGFSQACASASFNTYNITFAFSPESSLGASNQFIIELSDASGSFSNPTIVFTSAAGSVTTSPATLSLPCRQQQAERLINLELKVQFQLLQVRVLMLLQRIIKFRIRHFQ